MADYLLDTNVLLYRGGSAQGFDVSDFWDNELALDQNEVFVPREVVEELETQYYQMEAQGKEELLFKVKYTLIPHMEVVDIPPSSIAEQLVKRASSYICANYEIMKPPTSKQPNPGRWWNQYPGISDSRILLTALYNECTLATFNIQDFMLLLVLGEEVWNPIDNCPYPPIDPAIRQRIYQDPIFLNFKRGIDDFLDTY